MNKIWDTIFCILIAVGTLAWLIIGITGLFGARYSIVDNLLGTIGANIAYLLVGIAGLFRFVLMPLKIVK